MQRLVECSMHKTFSNRKNTKTVIVRLMLFFSESVSQSKTQKL